MVASSQLLSLNPILSMTRVSLSQCPVESPFQLGFNKNPIWTADPKNTPFRDVAETSQTPAGIGQMGENAAAAIADFVMVDMFANYCTGREDVKTAMVSAERSAKRIFR